MKYALFPPEWLDSDHFFVNGIMTFRMQCLLGPSSNQTNMEDLCNNWKTHAAFLTHILSMNIYTNYADIYISMGIFIVELVFNNKICL